MWDDICGTLRPHTPPPSPRSPRRIVDKSTRAAWRIGNTMNMAKVSPLAATWSTRQQLRAGRRAGRGGAGRGAGAADLRHVAGQPFNFYLFNRSFHTARAARARAPAACCTRPRFATQRHNSWND
ncbi:hypothetical protein EVAR_272_1 [Eumeta japonica]|uniref:Uncharacterized protein n=1 Tax=Eumeta variegata TaxID=151549 RepID=A0A4C1S976_EUMVA|nr:hypothetical protein EVAR_272_1 [Eumeta japonica]